MGASRRGVDMGPSAMRVAGLEARLEALGHQVTDGGNIRVEIAETQAFGSENARYLKQIAETCTRTAEAVVKTLEEGMTPLVLGGDHSLAVGSISGVSEFYRRQGQKIGCALDRCPFRHQHARHFALGECARHAAGLACWAWGRSR